MTRTQRVGIHGIGVYLPEHVRKNDWWPDSIVRTWRERAAKSQARDVGQWLKQATEGVKRSLAAFTEISKDPFQGAVERRVAADPQLASEMETAAAREALSRAQVAPDQIDFLMTQSVCPDYINAPQACVLHRNLELPEKCFAMSHDSMCNSFLLQLTLAEQMIASGQSRFGLLVQSSMLTRMAPQEEPYSAWLGDAATAVVVGPVPEDKGLLGRSHRANGALHRALVFGVPGRRWYEDGRVVVYLGDKEASQTMLMGVADLAKVAVTDALAEAGLSPTDIQFYAGHQGTRWMRRVHQEYLELDRARGVDTFAWAGNLSGCNVPLQLSIGEREGSLQDGDHVVLFSGGVGVTYSGTVMRWGK